MPTSQNGYSANDRSVIASFTVPGTTLRVALRKGDVSVVLLEYLRRYNAEVEPLTHVPQDLWGYAERTIRGSSTTLSNHASGTAVDTRATAHPLGTVGNFTLAQLTALDRLLAWFEGVIRHGKDYVGRKDPMHAEINAGSAAVARIATKIRALAGGPITPSGDWFDMATRDELKAVITEVMGGVVFQTTGTLPNRRGPGGSNLKGGPADTLWGYAMSADGAAYRIERALAKLTVAAASDDSTVTTTSTPVKTLADYPSAELLVELSRRESLGGQ